MSEFQGSYGDLATNILTAYAAGDGGPDVSQLGTFEIKEFYESGVLADVTRILGDHGISIEAMLQKEPEGGATDVPVIMLTQRVLERDMNDAISKIEALGSIRGEVTRIRMETLDS